VKDRIIVNKYPDQQYSTLFNQMSGMFLRIEDDGIPEPFWCSYGPELMDISITNWCDLGCDFCYKMSNNSGTHMSIENYEMLLEQAGEMKVSQIALGGGNPNQHPDFCEILRLTREKYNIVPSYTTNGRGVTNEILKSTKMYCGAVAVSAYEPYEEMIETISTLVKHKIKTNLHFLLTNKSVDVAISWLESLPEFLYFVNAIIFLNYKPAGRLQSEDLLANKHPDIERFFSLVNQQNKLKIGFDSCSISGIARSLDVNPAFVESCEAARFSMYISEDMMMYPCSFAIEKFEGINLLENKIQESWQYGTSFQEIRKKMGQNPCPLCNVKEMCSGGCPIYPEINFCMGLQ